MDMKRVINTPKKRAFTYDGLLLCTDISKRFLAVLVNTVLLNIVLVNTALVNKILPNTLSRKTMRKALSASMFLSVIMVLSGCSIVSNNDMFSKMREVFETQIFEDDSKRFSYMFISRVSGVNLTAIDSDSLRTRSASRRSNANAKKIKKPFLARLESKLAETGFCREGYMELSFTVFPTQVELIGECHESATSEDKARWGETA